MTHSGKAVGAISAASAEKRNKASGAIGMHRKPGKKGVLTL